MGGLCSTHLGVLPVWLLVTVISSFYALAAVLALSNQVNGFLLAINIKADATSRCGKKYKQGKEGSGLWIISQGNGQKRANCFGVQGNAWAWTRPINAVICTSTIGRGHSRSTGPHQNCRIGVLELIASLTHVLHKWEYCGLRQQTRVIRNPECNECAASHVVPRGIHCTNSSLASLFALHSASHRGENLGGTYGYRSHSNSRVQRVCNESCCLHRHVLYDFLACIAPSSIVSMALRRKTWPNLRV